jgi:hypothetical protein
MPAWIRVPVPCNPLYSNGWFDYIIKTDAHHSKVTSTIVFLSNKNISIGRSQQSLGVTKKQDI